MTSETIARYAKHMNPAFVRILGTFGYGRVLTRARGATVWDDAGRSYIDMLSGAGAANLGHNPPELIEKMKAFLDDDAINLVHTGPQVHASALAQELARLAGPPLDVALFSNSGGEAVEASIKLARAATGRVPVLYAEGGFHGTGLGPLSIMGNGRMRDPFEPLLPRCYQVPFGDLEALERALEERKPAAFVVEPVQAEAGILLPEPGYLREAQSLCRARGTIFVLDEVHTGLGRTGSMFAFQSEDFVPDVLVLGKALGGSMVPISATLTSPELQRRAYGTADKFDLHGTTYSGNAFASRIALETVHLIERQELPERAREMGEFFLTELRTRLQGHPFVRDVRGRGLLIGIELGSNEKGFLQRLVPGLVQLVSKKIFGQWLSVRLLERGIMCQPASQQWNVLRLEPPLNVERESVEKTIFAITDILDDYHDLLPLMKDVALRLGAQFRDGWGFR